MATPHHLPKKRGALKGTRISFLRDTFFEVSHSYVYVPPTLLCSTFFVRSHVWLMFYVSIVYLFVLFLMWVMCGYVLYSCMFAWIFCVCFCKSYVVVCLCESCITIYVFGINAYFLVVCLCLVVNFLVEWSPWCKFLILEWSVCV